MRRSISNKHGLVASLSEQQHNKAIESAGGFWEPERPNRELRRRMAREAKREAKRSHNKGETS